MTASPLEVFRARVSEEAPTLALVLGSGMNRLAEGKTSLARLPFDRVEGLTAGTVSGHRGRFNLIRWGTTPVLLGEGRLHFYEGHPWEVVTGGIRFLHSMGIRDVILTNAAGGLRADLEPGHLMVIRADLEMNRPQWWRESPGTSSPYSEELGSLLKQFEVREGVYGSVTGPCYETPAEIRAMLHWGVDAVGMSTTREARMAHSLGMRCAALSMITNKAAGLSEEGLSHEEVLRTGAEAVGRLEEVVAGLIESRAEQEGH